MSNTNICLSPEPVFQSQFNRSFEKATFMSVHDRLLLDATGESLRKFVVVLGVIVLLAGLTLVPLSATAAAIPNYNVKVQGTDQASWTISQSFNSDEILGVDFRPFRDWSENAPDFYWVNVTGTKQPARYLKFDITNPQSACTTIRLLLVVTSVGGGASGISVVPDYYEVWNSTSSDWDRLDPAKGYSDGSGGIVIEKGYPNTTQLPLDVGAWGGGTIYQLGKASTPGVYNVSVSLDPDGAPSTPNHRVSPPANLVIVGTNIETSYPYSWVLPGGIMTCVVGAVVTTLGAASKKDKYLKRT
jgi:hypothetical protein